MRESCDIEGFRRGDTDAIDVVRRVVSSVVRHRGYFIPREMHADVEQEAMLQLWREASRDGRDQPRAFIALVRTIAHRRCVDWMRRHRAVSEIPQQLPDSAPGPEGALESRERLELAASVLARLRESCRQLMLLHVVKRLSYDTIARELGRSAGALRVQMHDCLKQARALAKRAQMSVAPPDTADP